MIGKILTEINRLKNELDGYSAKEGLDYIESYINTLSKQQVKEPSEDLEEAAKKYATEWHKNPDGSAWKPYFEESAIKVFIAGAEWQKEQMLKEAVEDLALTWEDIEKIVDIHRDVLYDNPKSIMGAKENYEDTLRKFNEWREKNRATKK